MSHRLALLIAANPKQQDLPSASVYVSDGKWEIDISEILDSEIGLYINSPIFSENFIPYVPVEGKYIEGPGIFMVGFNKKGSESSITVMIEKCL